MDVIDLSVKRNERRRIYDELLEDILKTSPAPLDKYEIAAIIESLGWDDKNISKTFGMEDVFELAESFWQSIQQKKISSSSVYTGKKGFVTRSEKMARSFLRGTIFALPMAISVISMLALRLSLWPYHYPTAELAAAIAIGTILSFMAVGVFAQAIARKGCFYIQQGFFNMCRRITIYFVRMGFINFIALSMLFVLFNLFYQQLTLKMMVVAVVHLLFLSINWISVTIMYILQKELVFTGFIAAGTGMAYILFRILNPDIFVSQVIAMFFITVLGFISAICFFSTAAKKEKGIAPSLPKKSIMLYSIMPFFNYGFLYFTLLFCDRVISWSANNVYMPYFMWFRGDYELGLNFALLMLAIPMGISEVVLNRFMRNVENTQRDDSYDEYGTLNSNYIRLYARSMMLLFAAAIISAILIYTVVMAINSGQISWIYIDSLLSDITHFVFIIALAAYGILTIGLSNVMILLSLSQPKMITKPVFIALIVNVGAGLVLSRLIHYRYAVFGLLLGSIVFMVLSCRCVIKVLSNLDYYMYAAT